MKAALEGIGRLVAFSLDAAAALVRRPFAWRELLRQLWFVGCICLVPGLLVAAAVGAIAATQAAALTRGLGVSLPLAGVAPLLAAFVVVTAGGSAVCADLGGRALSREIDGLDALGVEPVQRLAVPRVIAMGLVTAVLTAAANAVLTLGTSAVATGWAAPANPLDGVVTGLVLGLVAGVVAVRHGFTARPGAAGAAVTWSLRASYLAVPVAAAVLSLARGAW